MRRVKLFILLLAGLFSVNSFCSCEKDDDNNKPDIKEEIVLSAPELKIPINAETVDAEKVSLSWDIVSKAISYQVWVDDQQEFTSLLIDKTLTENNLAIADSLANATYYWKVRALADTVKGPWSSANNFIVNMKPEDPETVDPVVPVSIVPKDAKVEQLSAGQGFDFLEGPVWDGSDKLYFSDINISKVHVYSVSQNKFSSAWTESSGANGLMFNKENQLVVCEGDAGQITVRTTTGELVKTLASEYDGKRFNRPNDLCIDKKGGIYFTDPTWGALTQDKKCLYYIKPNGETIRLVDDMNKPNGVLLSADGSILYIVDTENLYLRSYDVNSDGTLSNMKNFISLKTSFGTQSGADGMTMDINGNLYVTSSLGIQIYSKKGDYIDLIKVPETTSNCTFGGPDMNILYITARKNLYSIKLNTKGFRHPFDYVK